MKRGDRVIPTHSIASEQVINIPGTITATKNHLAHVCWDDGDKDWYAKEKLRLVT